MSQLLINQFFADLDRLKKVSGAHRESVVSEAFKDLLKGWGKQRDLVFIPQYEYETAMKTRVYPDGALLYSLRVPLGYWEAKDADDDLDKEIEKKKKRGYPQDNNKRKISVIIGNPPYNANQQNDNDNNKNQEYRRVDDRIHSTYIHNSTAQKTKLYDMYARFFEPVRIHYIREWLKKRGLAQADLVSAIGVDKSAVSKWCAGRLPSEENLLLVASFLEMSPEEVFRHPDEDWLSRMLRERSDEELARMVETIRAAFPRNLQKKKA